MGKGEGWEEMIQGTKASGRLHAKGYSRSSTGEDMQILSVLSHVRTGN